MRVLIESYNNVKQNSSGGVQIRINNFIKYGIKVGLFFKLFNKWEDKVVDYDVLHIFKLNFEDYQLMLLAKQNNIPVIISSVVPLENSFRILFNRLICFLLPIRTGYWFYKEMLKKADIVIAQTKKEAYFIKRYYGINLSKIEIIPNGVNIDVNQTRKLIKEKIKTEKPYVLQVGRFDNNKNQLSVIKALKDTDITVVFIGGPDPLQVEYYEKCKKIANKNMFFLGWVKNNDPLLSSAYGNAKVVVLPSYKEIFGNSLIEGGAYGANLVATDVLPISDWGISEICSTIAPNDIGDIKRKIMKAFNDPKNSKTSKIIRSKFSWEKVLNKYMSVYEKVVSTKK